ncbi:MAG: hypothetical protein ACR2LK_06025 [Solirubrobacteraceae bacterium]
MPAHAIGATTVPGGLVAALIAAGVLIALVGYLAGSRRVVIGGLAVLFAASALMIAGAYIAYRDDPSDPRPCAEPGTCN